MIFLGRLLSRLVSQDRSSSVMHSLICKNSNGIQKQRSDEVEIISKEQTSSKEQHAYEG